MAEKAFPFIRRQRAHTSLRREYEVIIDLGERGHERPLGPFDPSRVRYICMAFFRGLAPTAIHVDPLRGCRGSAPRREQLELTEVPME